MFLPKATTGCMRILFLANQTSARTFWSDLNYLINVAYKRTLEMLKIKSSKHLLWEVRAKLVEGQYVFLIQPKTLDNEKMLTRATKKGLNLNMELKRQ